MTRAIRRRLAGSEGFTLIELMVVVMIIAVLIAIAIPSFLGSRKSAQDRSAQAEIRNVLLSEKAFWQEAGDYTQTAGDITALEPNTRLNADPALGVFIDLNAASSDIVCMVRTAASGNTLLHLGELDCGHLLRRHQSVGRRLPGRGSCRLHPERLVTDPGPQRTFDQGGGPPARLPGFRGGERRWCRAASARRGGNPLHPVPGSSDAVGMVHGVEQAESRRGGR